jgi:predicted AAA+ superfamily ATPase
MSADQLMNALSSRRFSLENEKELQRQIFEALDPIVSIEREARLDDRSIIDFLTDDGIGIEVKIKGSAREILRQCERYAKLDQVKSLIIVTNRSMGFPASLNGKPCWVVNLGRAWL